MIDNDVGLDFDNHDKLKIENFRKFVLVKNVCITENEKLIRF